MIVVGVGKTCCGESKLELTKFMSKNIVNAISLAFYLTVQDMAFFCANIFMSLQLATMLDMVFFAAALLLSLLILAVVVWQCSKINYKYEQCKEDRLYQYECMVLFRMDYDLF